MPMTANRAKIAMEKMRSHYVPPTGVPLGAALAGGAPAAKRMTVAEKKEQERLEEEARKATPVEPAPAEEKAAAEGGEPVKAEEEAAEPVKKEEEAAEPVKNEEETAEPVKKEEEAAEPVKKEEETGEPAKMEEEAGEPAKVEAAEAKQVRKPVLSSGVTRNRCSYVSNK